MTQYASDLSRFIDKFISAHIGNVFGPASISMKFSCSYQKTSQIFGPIAIEIALNGFDINVNDEQLVFLLMMLHTFATHLNRLQLQSRVGFFSQFSSIMQKSALATSGQQLQVRKCLNRFDDEADTVFSS